LGESLRDERSNFLDLRVSLQLDSLGLLESEEEGDGDETLELVVHY
jgi:hypothetical protein